MNSKTEFVATAIKDIQATIRAIDVKVAALLVGLLAPLASTHRIFAHLGNFSLQSPRYLFSLVAVLFLLTWLLALIAYVRAIGAIDNPSQHIINSNGCKGAFYSGGLYQLGILDVFLNRDVIKASKDAQSFLAWLPSNANEIEAELVFEQMKLAYIRDMKLIRLKWGLHFSLLWLLLGMVIFLCSKYLIH